MNDAYAVILAAGKGTRMKSKKPKVLHHLCEKPMVQHVIDQVQQTGIKNIILVVGHGATQVQEQVGNQVHYALQEQQLGTGHAVLVTKDHLIDKQGLTVVLCGDTPLITAETLQKFITYHREQEAALTILTTMMDKPTGYGRIIRNEQGQVERIVEEKDASLVEKEIKEINTGMYCFDNQKLWSALGQLNNQNAQGEYYLTDCLQILRRAQEKACAYIMEDVGEALGVNDLIALAEAEKHMKLRINRSHMTNGVRIIDPEQTYIGMDVCIGADTEIYPGTVISGQTTIGEDCLIGPQTELRSMKIGNQCQITHSVLVESQVGDNTSIGPFAYVRPGTVIGNECKIGDFVEVKNSIVQDGTKIPHLSYIGDAEIGSQVNIGCGSITVNYDGRTKHKTIVEDGSFIGCNVNLVAPVTIGKHSFIAAGSTITDAVPENSFAIARERQITKENYQANSPKK